MFIKLKDVVVILAIIGNVYSNYMQRLLVEEKIENAKIFIEQKHDIVLHKVEKCINTMNEKLLNIKSEFKGDIVEKLDIIKNLKARSNSGSEVVYNVDVSFLIKIVLVGALIGVGVYCSYVYIYKPGMILLGGVSSVGNSIKDLTNVTTQVVDNVSNNIEELTNATTQVVDSISRNVESVAAVDGEIFSPAFHETNVKIGDVVDSLFIGMSIPETSDLVVKEIPKEVISGILAHYS